MRASLAALPRLRERLRPRRAPGPSRSRLESNAWLRRHASCVEGRVLSIGSVDDADGEGARYRDYFARCSAYLTSEVTATPGCDLTLDVRRMPEVRDGSFDAIYCSGVLEHVDDVPAALAEMRRVLRSGGRLLLGLPFRQAIHMAPNDFWRFTEHGIRFLLERDYAIEALDAMDAEDPAFPSAYWTLAVRR